MRLLLIAFGALLLSANAQAETDTSVRQSVLEQAKDQARLLVVCSETPPVVLSKLLHDQHAALDWDGYLERDLILLDIRADGMVAWLAYPNPEKAIAVASYIKGRDVPLLSLTNCSETEPRISLIGKDGGLKQQWDTAVSNEELFALIDAMPMRQQEMREAR